MTKLSRTSVALAVLLCVSLAPTWFMTHNQKHVIAEAFTARNLTLGSQGYDVVELQNRLKFLGFYHGKTDGVFGWQTYWAVRNFQYKFGMKVNGFVDMKSKMKLATATPNWHSQQSRHGSGQAAVREVRSTSNAKNSTSSSMPTVPGLSQSDLRLMAHVVYGEARGEPYNGEVAIAAVILNRMRDPRFPHSVSAIIYQPGAFTAVQDGQVNLQPDTKAMGAVVKATHGWDPSHGAVYYFNPATATSPWIWGRPEIVKIGKHIFCH